MSDEVEFRFYRTPGPMTETTSCPSELFGDMPPAPEDLLKVALGCMADRAQFQQRFGIPVPERDDASIRAVSGMISRIHSLDPSPLVREREPLNRFIGTCRNSPY